MEIFVIVVILLIFIIVGIRESDKEKKIQAQIEKAQTDKDKTLIRLRESLWDDRVLLLSTIVGVIKKYLSVLEDKLEQHTKEDDYGNLYIDKNLEKELVYFSQKVVLPELRRKISDGEANSEKPVIATYNAMLDEVSDWDISFALQDTLSALHNMSENYFGIQFEDTNEDIANKLLNNISNDSIDDKLLYSLHDALFGDNKEDFDYVRYMRQIRQVFMQDSNMTLELQGKLRLSQPIYTCPFVCLVFTLFLALHDSKSKHVPKEKTIEEDFIGNDPYKYEEYIKTLLHNGGFVAKRTRSSGDYGVDVLATKGGVSFAVQCKLFNRPVGVKAVQEVVSGRIFYKADYAIVVSNNSFTPAAKTLARKLDVTLVHHKNLISRLKSFTRDKEAAAKSVGSVKRTETETSAQDVQWTKQDVDDLITMILPTMMNGSK